MDCPPLNYDLNNLRKLTYDNAKNMNVLNSCLVVVRDRPKIRECFNSARADVRGYVMRGTEYLYRELDFYIPYLQQGGRKSRRNARKSRKSRRK